jgi:hypothetical protein
MNIKEKFEKLKEYLKGGEVRSKSFAYAGNSLVNKPKFKSAFECGKSYTIIKKSKVVKGSMMYKPLTMKEFKNSGLASVPTLVRFKEKIEEFENKGGQIVFSTDVNAVISKDGNYLNKMQSYIKGRLQTLQNRLLANKKLKKIMKSKDIYAFSIGNFFRGHYKDKNGNYYSEKSKSIEIIGIDEETLFALAKDIAHHFKQESVLVKDYDSGKISLVY